MGFTKISELVYEQIKVGFRVDIEQEDFKYLCDVETDEAKQYGIDKHLNSPRIKLVAKGQLIMSEREFKEGIVVDNVTSRPDVLKKIGDYLNKPVEKSSTDVGILPQETVKSIVNALVKRYSNFKVKTLESVIYIPINLYSDIKICLKKHNIDIGTDIYKKAEDMIKTELDALYKSKGFIGANVLSLDEEVVDISQYGGLDIEGVSLFTIEEYVYMRKAK